MAQLTGKTLKPNDIEPGLDQRHLFALGLEFVRELSSRQWTDHNVHDPGITILELLCHALTELTYRAKLPIEDLLAAPDGDPRSPANQFYKAAEILPNGPLTCLDYRKLLIDLPGVRNAWIHPHALQYFVDLDERRLRVDDPGKPGIKPVELRGLYRVSLEYDDDVTTDEARRQVDARAWALLQKNRNLCEDFVAVEGITTQYYSLCAEIDLTPDGDPIEVAAQIAFQVDQYLAPPIFNRSLEEMSAKRHADGSPCTPDEIFTGPPLQNGFLDDQEVARADLRSDVRLSDIISLIMDLPGVAAVRDIVVNPLLEQDDGSLQAVEPPNKWHLKTTPGRQSRLADDRVRLVFYKRNLPMRPASDKVRARRQSLQSEQRARFLPIGRQDVPIPPGRDRHTGSYYSVQHDFPVIYGLSESGVPPVLNNDRSQHLAQVLQLKGYLLFFDQVMADFCAQLANVGGLFSRHCDVPKTYSSQVVELPGSGTPDLSHRSLYSNPLPTGDELSAEGTAAAHARRDRFLDHLLARVGEDFHHYVDIMATAFGRGDVLSTKCEFLRDYPCLGAERGLSFNRTTPAPGLSWKSQQITGLERRLARLLGIDVGAVRNLTSVAHDTGATVGDVAGGGFRFQVVRGDDAAVLFESFLPYATAELARDALNRAIMRGQSEACVVRQVASDGRHYFHIVDADDTTLARSAEHFDSVRQLKQAIDEMTSYLRRTFFNEGMYVVENMLMRPAAESGPGLTICVDPDCVDCADHDPYSYRLQFLLPSYAGRFSNMDFRRFVEETIRQETPAHILPKVCWLDLPEMRLFEDAYREWLTLDPNAPSAEREQKRIALQQVMTEMKNVYPRRKLADCDDADGNPPFVLNQTRLGTT